jgi:hypothetical protein
LATPLHGSVLGRFGDDTVKGLMTVSINSRLTQHRILDRGLRSDANPGHSLTNVRPWHPTPSQRSLRIREKEKLESENLYSVLSSSSGSSHRSVRLPDLPTPNSGCSERGLARHVGRIVGQFCSMNGIKCSKKLRKSFITNVKPILEKQEKARKPKGTSFPKRKAYKLSSLKELFIASNEPSDMIRNIDTYPFGSLPVNPLFHDSEEFQTLKTTPMGYDMNSKWHNINMLKAYRKKTVDLLKKRNIPPEIEKSYHERILRINGAIGRQLPRIFTIRSYGDDHYRPWAEKHYGRRFKDEVALELYELRLAKNGWNYTKFREERKKYYSRFLDADTMEAMESSLY